MKSLFDGLTDILRSAQPSIFAFVETTLPYTTPAPIALISAASAGAFFNLTGVGAFFFVYSLEGIGLLSTTKLVESIIDFIRSKNAKTAIMIVVLLVLVGVYITILVSLNVNIHTEFTNPNFAKVLTLICYLPLIAGVLNGLNLAKLDFTNSTAKAKQEELESRLRQETLEERRLQEEQAERNRRWDIRHGVVRESSTSFQPVKPSKEKMPGDFKEYVFELLDAAGGNMALTEITAQVNKGKRMSFKHENAKGTWYKFREEWKRNHP